MLMQDLRLSVSKVKTFDSCQKKYKYTYVLKMPRKEQDFFVFGKFCHTVLENFHLEYLNGSSDPYNEVMTRIFKNTKKEYANKMTPETIKECFIILNRYLEIISRGDHKFLGKSILAVEKNFEIKLNDNTALIGMIDRVQIDDDGVLHVADYKTTKNKKYLKDDFFQLLTYGFVLMLEDPSIEKIRASYILLRHDFEYITKEFSKNEMLEMKFKYIDYANKIMNEQEYAAKPNWSCRTCDYFDICEEGKKFFNKSNGEVEW